MPLVRGQAAFTNLICKFFFSSRARCSVNIEGDVRSVSVIHAPLSSDELHLCLEHKFMLMFAFLGPVSAGQGEKKLKSKLSFVRTVHVSVCIQEREDSRVLHAA